MKERQSFFSGFALAWKNIKRAVGTRRFLLIGLEAVSVLLGVYGFVVQPYILSMVFGALEQGSLEALYRICGIGSIVILIFFIVVYLSNVYLDLSLYKMGLVITKDNCKRLYQLPYDTVQRRYKESEILNRIDLAGNGMILTVYAMSTFLMNVISIVVLLRMFSAYSYVLVIMVGVVAIWSFISGRLEMKNRRRYEKKRQEQEDVAGGLLFDSVHEMAFAVMNECTEHMYDAYRDTRRSIWKIMREQERITILLEALSSFFSSSMRGVLGGFLFPLYRDEKMDGNQVAASFSIYSELSAVVNGFAKPFISASSNAVYVERCEELLSIKNEKTVLPQEAETGKLVDLKHVSYNIGDRPILNQVNLQVEEGDKIALIGQNGCGKSTLLRLIAGLNHADSGNVHIDSRLLQDPHQISYIPSSNYLYAESVHCNMQMNGDGDVNYAVKLSELTDKNVLEQNATALSGGQGQRVNIARAMMHDSIILLADEPTSGLSIAQGEQITKNILENVKTAVVVTHHPAQLRFFNRVVLMEAGKVLYSGSLEGAEQQHAFQEWIGSMEKGKE